MFSIPQKYSETTKSPSPTMYCIPLLALAFATASHAAPSADSLSLEKTTSNILKGAYIVEFEAGDVGDSALDASRC